MRDLSAWKCLGVEIRGAAELAEAFEPGRTQATTMRFLLEPIAAAAGTPASSPSTEASALIPAIRQHPNKEETTKPGDRPRS
jgi:hypothetical protein